MTESKHALSPAVFDGFRAAALEHHLHLRQVHVYAEGRGTRQHNYRTPARENLYSGSKTFTSLAIGMAEAEGRLCLDDRLMDYFPEYRHQAGPYMEQVRLRDLLQMRSGKSRSMFEHASLRTEEDYAAIYIREGMVHEPGTVFVYSNLSTYMLGRVVTQCSGESLVDYLRPRLFDPLGYFNVQWHTCPHGYAMGFTELYLSTLEYARLGRLLLQNGVWDDRQLVPAAYIENMHTDLAPTKGVYDEIETDQGYGYQVWKNSHKDSYRADGLNGQFTLVYPAERAVITITADEEWQPYLIIRLATDELLPRLI